jgi:hypothetical protein
MWTVRLFIKTAASAESLRFLLHKQLFVDTNSS